MAFLFERCGDCGGEIKEVIKSRRADVCEECWERRGWLVAHMNKIVEWFGMAEFQALQRSMANHTGTAKRKILKMMRELPVEASNARE